MAKDAYYFSHDSNAHKDPKILKLRSKYGWEGYGIYWAIIETLREQENYKWSANDKQLLSFCFANGDEVINQVIDTCLEVGLLVNDGEYIYSSSLTRRMKLKDEISEKRRAAGKKGGSSKSGANAKQNVSNKNKENKENEENENKEIKDYVPQIKNLLQRYPSSFSELNKAYWNLIRETRVTNKIQESVILKTMEEWTNYSANVVEYALKRHLEIDDKNKDEKYTIGIMRKTTNEEALDKLSRMKPKGVKSYETDVYDNAF